MATKNDDTSFIYPPLKTEHGGGYCTYCTCGTTARHLSFYCTAAYGTPFVIVSPTPLSGKVLTCQARGGGLYLLHPLIDTSANCDAHNHYISSALNFWSESLLCKSAKETNKKCRPKATNTHMGAKMYKKYNVEKR